MRLRERLDRDVTSRGEGRAIERKSAPYHRAINRLRLILRLRFFLFFLSHELLGLNLSLKWIRGMGEKNERVCA